jgi:hypothetical protein
LCKSKNQTMSTNKFDQAIQKFDDYNSNDPSKELVEGREVGNNLLYGQRMSKKLVDFHPDASECLRLAARCQHIGRWEIPRKDYPMDRTGYLQWRSQLKLLHAKIAGQILEEVGYDNESIEKVQALLMKKQLKQNPETQVLEDVICLVFLQYYFDDFSQSHDEEKVISILKKTIAKMSVRGVKEALKLPLSDKARALIAIASS